MEEFKVILEMLASLPTLAVWVLAGFLVYKLAVVGSIFGLARLLIASIFKAYHETLNTPRRVALTLSNSIFDTNATREEFMHELERILYYEKERNGSDPHGVSALRNAINIMFEK